MPDALYPKSHKSAFSFSFSCLSSASSKFPPHGAQGILTLVLRILAIRIRTEAKCDKSPNTTPSRQHSVLELPTAPSALPAGRSSPSIRKMFIMAALFRGSRARK